MKILHLANHCHEIGNGIMNVAVDIACLQAAEGHEVRFASAGGSYVRLLERHGVAHRMLRQDWRRAWTLPGAAFQLARLVAREKPDIVHAHMMTGALLAKAVQRISRFRLVTTVHNEWQRSAVAMGVGDRVICVSASVASQMARRGIAMHKIDIVLNAPLSSPRRTSTTLKPPAALGHPSILTVAGMYKRKGIGDLIQAFSLVAGRNPTLTLTIVGDGPDRALFEAQAADTSFVDRIHFTGFVDDPRHYYRGADIFILASHNEPFGLVLAEAREQGCAIIGTRVGGIPEVLDDGRAGVLVECGNPPAIAEALQRMIEDHDWRDGWRKAATNNLERFNVRRAARETLDVYARAIGCVSGREPAKLQRVS